MNDESMSFEQAKLRLEDIAKQARSASLENCLDLLEESVKLANVCTAKIDQTNWREAEQELEPEEEPQVDEGEAPVEQE